MKSSDICSCQKVEFDEKTARGYRRLTLLSDFYDLLYTDGKRIYIDYAVVEDYYLTHSCDADPDNVEPNPYQATTHISSKDKKNVIVDLKAYIPVKPALPSLDILPYLFIYFTFPHIRFQFLTANNEHGAALADFASSTIYKQKKAWRTHLLDSGNVEEVRLWWNNRTVDIVLRAGNEWAVQWKCGKGNDECLQAKSMRRDLGLMGRPATEWRGVVVVRSVEDEAAA